MAVRMKHIEAEVGIASVTSTLAWDRWGGLVDLVLRVLSGMAWKGA